MNQRIGSHSMSIAAKPVSIDHCSTIMPLYDLVLTVKCHTIESNMVESRIGSYYLSSDDLCSTQHRDHPSNETKP
jgi:hypothetical protein